MVDLFHFHLELLDILLALLLWLLLQGKDIRAIRKGFGLTQEKFAEVMGVDWRTVQRWEKDELTPRPHRLLQLTDLRVRLDDQNETPPLTPEVVRAWKGSPGSSRSATLVERLEEILKWKGAI